MCHNIWNICQQQLKHSNQAGADVSCVGVEHQQLGSCCTLAALLVAYCCLWQLPKITLLPPALELLYSSASEWVRPIRSNKNSNQVCLMCRGPAAGQAVHPCFRQWKASLQTLELFQFNCFLNSICFSTFKTPFWKLCYSLLKTSGIVDIFTSAGLIV